MVTKGIRIKDEWIAKCDQGLKVAFVDAFKLPLRLNEGVGPAQQACSS